MQPVPAGWDKPPPELSQAGTYDYPAYSSSNREAGGNSVSVGSAPDQKNDITSGIFGMVNNLIGAAKDSYVAHEATAQANYAANLAAQQRAYEQAQLENAWGAEVSVGAGASAPSLSLPVIVIGGLVLVIGAVLLLRRK